MQRLKTYIICLGVLAMALPVKRARAMDGIHGKVGGFVEFFNEDEDNAKFNEYRYKQDDEFGGQAYFDFFLGPVDGEGEHRAEADVQWRSPEDIDAEGEHKWFGVYDLNVDYQRMGHVFAYDRRTLFDGIGTGTLTVPDNIPAVVNAGKNISNISGSDIGFLENSIAGGNLVDLQLQRERLQGDIDIFVLKPFTFRLGVDYQTREGTRPFGAGFGEGGDVYAVEIAEPIDYETINVDAEMEYMKGPFFGNIRVYHSSFLNNIESVTYDDPATPGTFGRHALYPDNFSNGFTVTLAHDLPFNSRVTSATTFQWNRQDENLLPFTTRSEAITGLPLVPRTSTNAKVDTELYNVQLVTHPIDKLHGKAAFRYYSHENRTIVQTVLFRDPTDDLSAPPSPDDDPFTPAYVSYIMRTVEGELSYEVLDRTTLTFKYELEGNSFENGSADKEDINIYEAAIDSWTFDWLRVQLSTKLTDKNSLYKDNLQTSGEIPWQRKYYAASKDRFEAHGMGTVMVADWISFTLDYVYGQDDYDFSPLGVKESRDHHGTVSADVMLDSWLSFNAWYTYENYKVLQKSHQWQSFGFRCSPFVDAPGIDSVCDWTLESTDNIHTVGFATHIVIIPDKLTADADGVFTTVNALADFESPVGTSDTNAFPPEDFNQVDETKLVQVNGRLTYAVNPNLDIFGGFIWEDWQIEDWQYNGFSVVPTDTTSTLNGPINMDTLYRDYTVGTAYAGAEYRFGSVE